MSNEAPKKIVLGFDYDGFPAIGGDTLYIRADIVDELVEALEEFMYARTDKAEQMAETALAKAMG